jgi:preprotein translocase subunit SecA
MLSDLTSGSSRRTLNRLVQLAQETALKLNAIRDSELLQRSHDWRSILASSRIQNSFRFSHLRSIFQSGNRRFLMLREPLALASLSVERQFGFRPYPEQLLAAAAVAQGRVIDMKTGEGKSVVAMLAAYLYCLCGDRVHLATTNAYLAQRDAENGQGFFDRLGVSVGTVLTNHQPSANRTAYQRDVVIGPGYQFGFDFLKDQAQLRSSNGHGLGRAILNELHGQEAETLIQPTRLDIAIVDEADSVLIDEALTPLILSAAADQEPEARPFTIARDLSANFIENQEYCIESGQIRLTATGHERVKSSFSAVESMRLERPWSVYLENALAARLLFRRDEHYIVADRRIKIVDYQTGRIFDDRSWQNGLHQAMEAYEDVPLTPSREVLARVTRQRFFQRYKQVTGLSGTLDNLDQELSQTYRAKTFKVPTHRPCQRIHHRPRFFADWQSKLNAITVEVKQLHAIGRPILLGTRTIHASRDIASRLEREGLRPIILNGTQDQDEAELVAQAGRAGAVMVATNMAGRGTDIKLSAESRKLGGLHVIGTEAHDSTRVDLQLIGRSARQGDPGSSQFWISAEDHLLTEHDFSLARKLRDRADARGEIKVDFSAAIRQVQQLVEDRQRIAREHLQLHDRWLDSIRQNFEKIA